MKKKSISNEVRTGLVVVICLVILAALLIRVGNYTFFKKGYILKSRFHYTGGVKLHAPVALAGVEIGQIKSIHLLYGDETIVETDLLINEGTKIRKDAVAYSTTYGLMGEKYIEIRPGTSKADYAQDGDVLNGEDPVRLEELVAIGKKVASDISNMANNISNVAKNIDGVIGENRGKINRIFDNIEDASENFDYFSENIMHHPWKFLNKGPEMSKEEMEAEREKRCARRQQKKLLAEQKMNVEALAIEEAPAAKAKQNFATGNKK